MNLLLFSIAVAWIGVGVHALVRRRRNERPNNSVVSFREQLANLERAAPGSVMRVAGNPADTGAITIAAPNKTSVQRRREVLAGLAGSTLFTFLLFVLLGGPVPGLLFFASAAALGAYVYALRQLHLRRIERSAKVKAIRLPAVQPAPRFALTQSAAN